MIRFPNDTQSAPVAIGGVGGSGTRLIAEMARLFGIKTGEDVNPATDTLWFTLLFKRPDILESTDAEFNLLASILEGGLRGGHVINDDMQTLLDSLCIQARPKHPTTWLRERADSLLAASRKERHEARWGWKEPSTHILIERFWQRWPTLKYVHVVRHGLDMAYSRNQNQLKLWGPHVLGSDGPRTPARSLRYWCLIHQRMQGLLANNPERMYWLDYDALCQSPAQEAQKLCRFLGGDFDRLQPLLDLIRRPDPPRHATEPLDAFDPADVDYVRFLGYEVAER